MKSTTSIRAGYHRYQAAAGFTLLEVIIALAILAVALGVLTEVSRLSLVNADRAALETGASLVAESVLAEMEAGTAEIANFAGEWVDDEAVEPEWSYEVVVEPTALEEILLARITVSQIDPGDKDRPVSFQLVRWFQDPDYLAQLETTESSG